MPTLSETLDNLYTTTWQNMKRMIADQIFDGTPFWFWLRDHGGLEDVEGGRFLTEPLRFAKSDNVKFISKGERVNLAAKEFLTTSYDDWRYLVDTIVRFGVEDQQNRGKNKIISLMQAKVDNSRDSLTDKMETTLVGAQSGKSFNGLQDLVADDPTAAGTVQGIDQVANTWWRNQTKDMSGSSFTDNGVSEMNTMLNNCSKNIRQDRPNIIVSGQTPYEYYWEETLEQKRISNKKLGDAGFENVEFRGVPLVWTPAMALRMYFLNTRFLKFKRDPSIFFDMTRWKEIPDQVNDRAAQILTAGNLMTSRRRVHGVMHTIDTP